ncbi:phage/plasmid primase, P4 family [Streptomyces sp. NPDC102405]|uniref:DNA primase family protein n=1 Tax=Streptomyces sp. NPDC102405 TaxID=3366170 RepID=UPI00382581A3
MTSPGNEAQALFDFNPEAVAAQIRGQAAAVPLPAQAVGERPVTERPAGEATAHGLLPDTLTDRGNAKLFVKLYANDYRHVSKIGWYRWDTTRWQLDEDDTVLWAAGDLAAHDPRGLFTNTALHKHRTRAMSTAGMHAMLSQAKSAPGMVLKPDRLDADPYALCTPQGIVDLRTGLLTAPDPNKDFHSRSTTVGPQQMPITRWIRFLTDTFGDDPVGREMIDYLQLLLGYSITGDVGAQILPFLWGKGKNGKSVLLDVLMKLLGDYADAAPPGFLMAKPFEGHPTDLAELHGRRVYVCSEIKPDDKFDEARVKLLTGGDRIKARRMRQDPFSFEPTHKLWLLGNHKPEVGTGGFAFWRRRRLIPFERIVSDDRKIDNLADLLVMEEGPGILAWLIEGARRYLGGDRDLTGPERVRIATSAYAETEDNAGRFYAECCRLGPDLRAEQTALYNVYMAWCQNEGVKVVSSRAFAARTRELVGLTSPKEMILSNSRKYYPGIGLLTDEERETGA